MFKRPGSPSWDARGVPLSLGAPRKGTRAGAALEWGQREGPEPEPRPCDERHRPPRERPPRAHRGWGEPPRAPPGPTLPAVPAPDTRASPLTPDSSRPLPHPRASRVGRGGGWEQGRDRGRRGSHVLLHGPRARRRRASPLPLLAGEALLVVREVVRRVARALAAGPPPLPRAPSRTRPRARREPVRVKVGGEGGAAPPGRRRLAPRRPGPPVAVLVPPVFLGHADPPPVRHGPGPPEAEEVRDAARRPLRPVRVGPTGLGPGHGAGAARPRRLRPGRRRRREVGPAAPARRPRPPGAPARDVSGEAPPLAARPRSARRLVPRRRVPGGRPLVRAAAGALRRPGGHKGRHAAPRAEEAVPVLLHKDVHKGPTLLPARADGEALPLALRQARHEAREAHDLAHVARRGRRPRASPGQRVQVLVVQSHGRKVVVARLEPRPSAARGQRPAGRVRHGGPGAPAGACVPRQTALP